MKQPNIEPQSLNNGWGDKAIAMLSNDELLERLKNCQPVAGSKSNHLLTIFTKYMQAYLHRVNADTMEDTIWITTDGGDQVLAGQYYNQSE